MAAVLAVLAGFFGIHRFYVGKVGSGVLMLLTAGGVGFWWLIDVVLVLMGSFKDKLGRPLSDW